MEAFLLLLAFPLIWPFVAKHFWHTTINWTEMLVQMVVVTIVVTGVWFAGKYSMTADTEIWNGYVAAKDRDHGHYIETYDCNCSTTCDSNNNCTESCDTCYEDHYTVTWTASTTVGTVTFDHLDSTWRSVYNSPDPVSYKRCMIGEPASLEKRYTNYVQAVPESLFHDNSKLAEEYAGKIPAYPRVYGFYHINRILASGTKIPPAEQKSLNDTLNNALKTLGAQKEVNIVVILTEIDNPQYRHAVENAWLGGEKNDVIVLVGLNDKTITWADVMTWALNKGNELFHVELRDAVLSMKELDVQKLGKLIPTLIKRRYDRPNMSDFEYLKDAIEPPTWVIILTILLSIGGSLGLSFYFHHYEMEDVIGNIFTHRKRRMYL